MDLNESFVNELVGGWLRQQLAWQETETNMTLRSGLWLLYSVMTPAAWSSPVVTVFLAQLFSNIKSGRISHSGVRDL